jgi:type I restriction-modification system DNA methylase subunit
MNRLQKRGRSRKEKGLAVSLISNPPYNLRWKHPALAGFIDKYAGYTLPPEQNANYAFVLSGLNMVNDRAVYLLPNGVLASGIKEECELRKQLIKQNVLLAVITLPPNMFESTTIPTCLLVFDKNKKTRKTAMIDLRDHCEEEVRDQRGQFGGASHTNRVYHKTVNIIPSTIMSKCAELLTTIKDDPGFCRWVMPEELESNEYVLTPWRYIDTIKQEAHRPFKDIADDYNRIVNQKNEIKIRMNKTAAKRLGFDCMDVDKPDLEKSFAVAGQSVTKEDFISFSADDGIRIQISTKDGIHPLIIDFLNKWKQMIIYLNNEENRYFAEFRDALLPDLLSGKIEVKDGSD